MSCIGLRLIKNYCIVFVLQKHLKEMHMLQCIQRYSFSRCHLLRRENIYVILISPKMSQNENSAFSWTLLRCKSNFDEPLRPVNFAKKSLVHGQGKYLHFFPLANQLAMT